MKPGDAHCLTHVHCVACRTDRAWRESLHKAGLVDTVDFACPYGVTPETAAAIQGEAIARLPGYNHEEAAKRKAELEQKGRAAWEWLHKEALKGALTVERLTVEFLPMVPKYGCGCVKGWLEILKAIPFRQDDQFAWSVEVHNAVSRKIPKPELTLEEAQAVWR